MKKFLHNIVQYNHNGIHFFHFGINDLQVVSVTVLTLENYKGGNWYIKFK
jgi:hypothetical protein